MSNNFFPYLMEDDISNTAEQAEGVGGSLFGGEVCVSYFPSRSTSSHMNIHLINFRLTNLMIMRSSSATCSSKKNNLGRGSLLLIYFFLSINLKDDVSAIILAIEIFRKPVLFRLIFLLSSKTYGKCFSCSLHKM